MIIVRILKYHWDIIIYIIKNKLWSVFCVNLRTLGGVGGIGGVNLAITHSSRIPPLGFIKNHCQVSHEIRNPLSAINMYLGALKTALNGTDAQELENHETVNRIAAQIQAMVEQFKVKAI